MIIDSLVHKITLTSGFHMKSILCSLTTLVCGITQTYAALNSLVVDTSDGAKVYQEGPATLTRHRDGLWIMNLYGTRKEMAAQHGRLVAKGIKNSALEVFMHKISHGLEVYEAGFFSKIMVNYVYASSFKSRIPKEEVEIHKAFMQAVNVERSEYLNALIFPDLGEYLMAKLYSSSKVSSLGMIPGKGLGCTSVVVEPSQSRNGLLFARNFDFYGLNAWDGNAAVIYFHPSEPGAMSYASISTLGIHLATPTAFNEAGLMMTLHQNTVDQVSRSGKSIVLISEEVIRKAKTIDEAIAILKSYSYATPWKIVVASAKEGKSAMIEVSADHIVVHPSQNGIIVETNHVKTPQMKKDEFSLNFRYTEDSVLRHDRLLEKIRSAGQLSIQNAVDLISGSEISMQGKTVYSQGLPARMDNVQSVVFVPQANIVYVAVPEFSFAKPVNGRYVPVPMIFTTDSDRTMQSQLAQMPPDLKMSRPVPEDVQHAHAYYRMAAVQGGEEGDLAQAVHSLAQATSLQPQEPLYPLMSALTHFRWAGLVYKKNMQEAEQLLKKGFELLTTAEALQPSPYFKSVISLFKGRYLDLVQMRNEAQTHYREVQSAFSQPLSDAKKAGMKKPYAWKKLKEIIIDYIDGDLYTF